MQSRKQGVTLLEIVFVMAIIGLLLALLQPVLRSAMAAGKQSACISNLRQVGTALTLYADAYDGHEPPSFAEAKIPIAILHCPSDSFEPAANIESSKQLGAKVSYFYLTPSANEIYGLDARDPNHGTVVCVTHGQVLGAEISAGPKMSTTGTVLRLRKDGSVQTAQVGHYCVSTGPGGGISGRPDYLLYSDTPCPEQFCPAGGQKCP